MTKARSALAVLAVLLPAAAPAGAQDWFVPNQGQGPGQAQPRPAQPAQQPARPAQQQQQQPRPAQGAQRPVQPNPSPLPPGQPPPDAVIGIVDVPEVQRNSSAFNSVREEIEKRRQRLNDDLQREQGKWRDAQQALQGERATLQPDALRTRERELQERVTESQRVFRDRSRGIEQAAQAALGEIEQALAVVIRQVAGSRKVNIVMPRALVIFNDAPFDLTDEISGQLNRVLRTVTLAAEGAPAAAVPAPPPAPPARPAQAQGQGQPPRRN